MMCANKKTDTVLWVCRCSYIREIIDRSCLSVYPYLDIINSAVRERMQMKLYIENFHYNRNKTLLDN